MTEIRIYFEGDRSLRDGFRAFFREIADRARSRRCKFDLIATGATPKKDFAIALRTHKHAWNILLLDSDGPVNEQASVDPHKDSIFWMVEMMESWFHADKDALKKFYKQGFNANALPANPNVQQIRKQDLTDGLKAASKQTKKADTTKPGTPPHSSNRSTPLSSAATPPIVNDSSPPSSPVWPRTTSPVTHNHRLRPNRQIRADSKTLTFGKAFAFIPA